MKALQLVAWRHEPELREVPQPDPGPGQVLVRIAGAGACHSDLHLLHDFDASMMPFELPFTLGHENAGHVAALGPGVSGWEIGEPVAVHGPWGCGRCPRCRRSAENYCERMATTDPGGGGLGLDGGMAEYLLVPAARHLVPLGDLDPVLAAPLTDAGLTPYHAIARSLPLLVPGSSTVVIGAGGLGHLAVQILAAVCATRVIAVDPRPTARDLATSSGAHHAVAPGPDAAAEIRELTAGRGAELVLDLVGTDDSLLLAAGVVRTLGQVTLVGIGMGTYPYSFFTAPYEASFTSTYWGSATELMEVVALATAGHLRPHVTPFPLGRAAEAYAALAAGQVDGRAVIVPD